MTIKVVNAVWEHYPEGGSRLLVMLALADYAGKDDGSYIFPSMDALAEKCRMSKRQVQRIVHELHGTPEQPGDYLELVTPGQSGGRRRPNHYRIKVERMTNCHPLPEKGCHPGYKRVTFSAQKGDIAMSPEPNNHLEPVRVTNSVSEWNQESENRIVQLAGYIRSLKAMPENNRPPGELERAEGELNELRLRAGDL